MTLADETDRFGPPVARVEFSYSDNDRAMMKHAPGFMDDSLAAVGVTERRKEWDDICHLNGTARMGDVSVASVVNGDCRNWDIHQSVGL